MRERKWTVREEDKWYTSTPGSPLEGPWLITTTHEHGFCCSVPAIDTPPLTGYCKYSLLQEATHNSHCSNLCHSCQPHGRFKIQSCFMYSRADLNQTLWMKELNVLAILGSESMALRMLGKHSTISDHKWATSLALVILKQKLSILPCLALVSSCSLGIPRTCYPCVHCISRRVQHVVLPDFCHLEDLSRFIYIVLSWTCFPFPFLSK
jgi:hypothetical protein